MLPFSRFPGTRSLHRRSGVWGIWGEKVILYNNTHSAGMGWERHRVLVTFLHERDFLLLNVSRIFSPSFLLSSPPLTNLKNLPKLAYVSVLLQEIAYAQRCCSGLQQDISYVPSCRSCCFHHCIGVAARRACLRCARCCSGGVCVCVCVCVCSLRPHPLVA